MLPAPASAGSCARRRVPHQAGAARQRCRVNVPTRSVESTGGKTFPAAGCAGLSAALTHSSAPSASAQACRLAATHAEQRSLSAMRPVESACRTSYRHPVFMPSSSRVLSVPCASGMLGSAEPAGTIARSRTDTDTSARRWVFRVAWASRTRHPPRWPRTLQSHTLPVDVEKSVLTLAHEQERLVFLSMPSQHETAQMDRPIFQSFADPLHVALGHKIG
jgi:hypothetical protein